MKFIILQARRNPYENLFNNRILQGSEQEAYEKESAAIDEIGLEHLTNATYGHRPRATSSPLP